MEIDYDKMYAESQVDFQKLDEAENIAYQIRINRTRYEKVGAETQVPWFVIAAIHNLESSLNFGTHLHNGDPLDAKTVHVPRNRPYSGNPPFTWEDSAIDALTKSSLWRPAVASNWTMAQCLEYMERYNGLGYIAHQINTPYLWSGTNLYTKGLFVDDDKFDPEAVSGQIGAVALIKIMLLKGYIQGECL